MILEDRQLESVAALDVWVCVCMCVCVCVRVDCKLVGTIYISWPIPRLDMNIAHICICYICPVNARENVCQLLVHPSNWFTFWQIGGLCTWLRGIHLARACSNQWWIIALDEHSTLLEKQLEVVEWMKKTIYNNINNNNLTYWNSNMHLDNIK